MLCYMMKNARLSSCPGVFHHAKTIDDRRNPSFDEEYCFCYARIYEYMDARRIVTIFALSAIFFASFFVICKQMNAPCISDLCFSSMGAEQSMAQDSGCDTVNATCAVTNVHSHTASFMSLYPTITTDMSVLSFAVAFAIFVILLWCNRGRIDPSEIIQSKLKQFQRRLLNAEAPDFFVLAFSRGILNSKRYASF
jgi:hypothetical protein